MRALVALLFAVACWWPTRELPWPRMDAPRFVMVTDALAKRPLAEQPRAALDLEPIIGPVYAGIVNPVVWLTHVACARVVGWDVRAHRLLRLGAFVLLAWWVMAAATRISRSRGLGLAAALGFLAFPAHIECWTFLPIFEPIQVLCIAACLASLWIWALPRRSAGWLWLSGGGAALAVGAKSTSWCLVLPLAVFTLWSYCATRGRERRRLLSGLAGLWIGLALLLGAYLLAGGGTRKAGAWVSNYRVEARGMARVLAHDVDELWRATALLVPLAALGLALAARSWRSRRALALLGCAAWAGGAFLIYLPWSAPASRYWLLGSGPLAVVVATGLRGAWIAFPPRVLAVACLAWMAFQFASRRDALVTLEAARDGSLAAVVEWIAREAPPGATVAHACPAQPNHDLFRFVAAHLATFARRADLKFSCAALGTAGEAQIVVATPFERGALPGTPALELVAEPWHREPPDPRYALWCLRTGRPVGDPGWKEDWRWRVYVTPSSPPASPARP